MKRETSIWRYSSNFKNAYKALFLQIVMENRYWLEKCAETKVTNASSTNRFYHSQVWSRMNSDHLVKCSSFQWSRSSKKVAKCQNISLNSISLKIPNLLLIWAASFNLTRSSLIRLFSLKLPHYNSRTIYFLLSKVLSPPKVMEKSSSQIKMIFGWMRKHLIQLWLAKLRNISCIKTLVCPLTHQRFALSFYQVNLSSRTFAWLQFLYLSNISVRR